MDRRYTANIFRVRLSEALVRSGLTRSGLARRSGVDRSTLSQLLAVDQGRLPRADTAAALASALQVSLDWLLGLSQEAKRGADILQESLQITPSTRTPVDAGLARWHAESAGYKIRYVPTTLPDLAKTEAVIHHEYSEPITKTTAQAAVVTRDQLDYTRMPETDMEICMARHTWQEFAQGQGLWAGLEAPARQEQIDRMIDLLDELYPSLRLYLFDGLRLYSVPYMIFGPKRAAVYIGQSYFVFNTTEHVRGLTNHFDELVRAAVVQAHQTADFLRSLDVTPPDA